jgi:NitT/TauT family transport system substrate-binding protein
LIEGFASTSQAAKRVLEESDEAWAEVRPLMGTDEEATFQALKRAFIQGIPKRSLEAERSDAERLYMVLRTLGGEKLVGPGTALPVGLYWGDNRKSV